MYDSATLVFHEQAQPSVSFNTAFYINSGNERGHYDLYFTAETSEWVSVLFFYSTISFICKTRSFKELLQKLS